MPRRFLASFTDAHLMVALPFFAVIAVTMQFILQMNRMLGINVLGYFAAGVYRRPKAEERVFLFIDLVGSTQLAERLGSARYFDLLRRFVDDLSEPVVEADGEIYRYAGTRSSSPGRWRPACARPTASTCFFAIRAAVAATLPGTSASSGWCRASGRTARRQRHRRRAGRPPAADRLRR